MTDRKTFTVPEGHEAELDAAGRATGWTRSVNSAGVPVARHENIGGQRITSVEVYPYSTVVGTGMLLKNSSGAVIGQLSLLQVTGGQAKAEAIIQQAAMAMERGLTLLAARDTSGAFARPEKVQANPINWPAFIFGVATAAAFGMVLWAVLNL